jgi:RNA polymerase sigma-70 factor (ECF subfamily)
MTFNRASRKNSAHRESPILASFLRHESFLKRFIARYLPQPEDVDEVVQESFLRAYAAEQRKPIDRPKSFLFQIARNEALDRLRRKSHQITDYIEDLGKLAVKSSDFSAEELLEQKQKMALFCEAVATLPVQCRKAFLLRKVYGLSHKEVADELGIAVSTVEKHQAAALMRCSQYMLEKQAVQAGSAEGAKNIASAGMHSRGLKK